MFAVIATPFLDLGLDKNSEPVVASESVSNRTESNGGTSKNDYSNINNLTSAIEEDDNSSEDTSNDTASESNSTPSGYYFFRRIIPKEVPKDDNKPKEDTTPASSDDKEKEANYIIVYEKQELDGSYAQADSETKRGTIGQEVSPTPKEYEGFKTPEAQTKTIAADDGTVITYRYERESYAVSFNAQGGSKPADASKKYEEAIGSLPATVRNNFKLEGW